MTVLDSRGGSGTPAALDAVSGSQRTSEAGTGSGNPLRVSSPSAVNVMALATRQQAHHVGHQDLSGGGGRA